MNFSTQLFESEHLVLAAYDPDRDAAIEAGFTRNPDYAWSLDPDGIPHPLTVFEVKKMREEALKESENKENCIYFSIRSKEGDRFLGTVVFPWISWNNQNGGFRLTFGQEEDETLYFDEAMTLTLRYAIEELGLVHTNTWLGAHDETRVKRFFQAGLELEVRQRQMVYRHGRMWDRLGLGISREKWLSIHAKG